MSSFVKEQHLSLYRELKITKPELQQAIGEDLHNVECQKAYRIKRSDVVNAIQLLQNGTISNSLWWNGSTWSGLQSFLYSMMKTQIALSVY